MSKKNAKFECVYAGPEMMGQRIDKPEPPAEGTVACWNCGAIIPDTAFFCSQCGIRLKPEPPSPNDPPQCMATYAGPPITPDQAGMPGIGIGIAIPYPQNYQTADEEPIDVYAGPPIDGEPCE